MSNNAPIQLKSIPTHGRKQMLRLSKVLCYDSFMKELCGIIPQRSTFRRSCSRLTILL